MSKLAEKMDKMEEMDEELITVLNGRLEMELAHIQQFLGVWGINWHH
jgi:hypothetical protein